MSARKLFVAASAMLGLALGISGAAAQQQHDPGASDAEIRIGNIMPYSGPASAYGVIGRVEAAYFRMINDAGGINGRKIRFISLDDGYNPGKTFEVARRLVEQERVLLLFNCLGTPTNSAIHKYMNASKVPQLFVAAGASKWGDPKHYPWTMGGQPSYQTEGRVYARHILKTRPDARIGVLYQNDDYGKDYLKGFREGLGDKNGAIVSAVSYEVTDPTIDSQIIELKASGADVFFDIATPKFAALAIRKAYDIGWHPVHYLNSVSNSIGSVLTPAGPDKAVGLYSAAYLKDPVDPRWRNDAGIKAWRAFMSKYYPEGSQSDYLNVYGYAAAQLLVQVLRQAGDTLTRDNIMKQAANLRNVQLDVALPGVKVNTSPSDYSPFESLQLEQFNGKQWVLLGGVIGE